MMKKSFLLVMMSGLLLTGCVDKGAINADFRLMDQNWGAENRQVTSNLKHRLAAVNKEDAVALVVKTFEELGMTVVNSTIQEGYVLSRSIAPLPLSEEEWEIVREVENPKLTEYVGWMITIESDPSAHFVIVKATITEVNRSDSEVELSATMEMPVYVNMGLVPFKEVPPKALAIATSKIWAQLDRNVMERN